MTSRPEQKSAETAARRSVAFPVRLIPHYRVEFFNGLRERLRAASIDLVVFADYAAPQAYLHDALDQVQAAVAVSNCHFGLRDLLGKRFVHTGGESLRPPYWQPIFRRLLSFDLVVVEQSNSALLNYPLLAWQRLAGKPRIAFWGHGQNLQRRDKGLLRWIKNYQTRRADHWFVYTDLSAEIVRRLNIPDDIITVVNNSVDTTAVKQARRSNAAARRRKKAELGLSNVPVAVFCARLTENKALPFLIDACRAARAKSGEFNLLVIGQGPYGPWLHEQANKEPWIHPMGPLYGDDKADLLALSDVLLLPSMVGLSIVDGFAAGLPVLSARFGNHSPEVAYLRDGVNGLMTDATVEAYANGISRVLGDSALREALSAGAREAADRYSVEAMIENFAGGIERVLSRKSAS